MEKIWDKYESVMERVTPSENLIENVLMEQREREYWEADKKADREKRLLRFGTGALRTVVMACIFCVCFLFSLQVVAGGVPQVYELLYSISPATAQFFKPVNKVSENDGIRMEVVSAYVHDNVAEICITMEDLSGDRIDESIDIGERYSIYQPYSAIGSCRLLDYDEERKRATFMVTVTQWDTQEIVGKKLTFSVREFSSGLQKYHDVRMDVDLAKANKEPKLESKWLNGFSGGREWAELQLQDRANWKVLPPSGEGVQIEVITKEGEKTVIDGMELSGLAYADGYLRVQTRSEKNFKYNNHAYLWLEDAEGNYVDCVMHCSYNEEEMGDYTCYAEFAFAVSEEELGNYTLCADIWTYDFYKKGPWQVTFPLEQPD